MTSAVSLNMIPHHFHEQGGRVCSSFFGRIFHINWDKAHLLANLVLVVAGIAYAFFSKLPPMIMLCLGIYGCLVAVLYAKAQKSRPSQNEIDILEERLAVVKEKYTLFEEKFKAEMAAQDVSETLQQEVTTYTAKLNALAAQKVRTERELQTLRRKKDSLQRRVNELSSVLERLAEESRRTEPGSPKHQALLQLKARLGV